MQFASLRGLIPLYFATDIKLKTQRKYSGCIALTKNKIYQSIIYREELVPVILPAYYPDKILSRLNRAGQREYLVHRIGYPDKSNSHIMAGDMARAP